MSLGLGKIIFPFREITRKENEKEMGTMKKEPWEGQKCTWRGSQEKKHPDLSLLQFSDPLLVLPIGQTQPEIRRQGSLGSAGTRNHSSEHRAGWAQVILIKSPIPVWIWWERAK